MLLHIINIQTTRRRVKELVRYISNFNFKCLAKCNCFKRLNTEAVVTEYFPPVFQTA